MMTTTKNPRSLLNKGIVVIIMNLLYYKRYCIGEKVHIYSLLIQMPIDSPFSPPLPPPE